ncbi:protein cereblon-like isoform X2 [Choristoneura fumiferana]
MDEEDAQAGGDGDSDGEEQQFDITLPATHSYMGSSLEVLTGRRLLEPGWAGVVAGAAHHGALFPGETVPMLLPPEPLRARILHDRLFCLLAPDETGTRISGFGVVCEVLQGAAEAGVIARATHRARLRPAPGHPTHVHAYSRMQLLDVVVLPELAPGAPLRPARLASLDPLRRPDTDLPLERRLRRMDAAGSAWPAFVWRLFDYRRLRARLAEYFRTLQLEDKMPLEPVSLSFWVASNLALSPRDRLALFAVDNALLRLSLALRCIDRSAALCCGACGGELARRAHMFAMSSDGVHANYTNHGGFMHDIVTVRSARNTSLGAPSAEYSWFPGYCWRVAQCAGCTAHVGWRFDAMKKRLRPAQFYALCRNVVLPRDTAPRRDLL